MTITVPLDATATTQNLIRHVQAVIAQRYDLMDYGVVTGGATHRFPGLGFHAFALPDTTLDRRRAWRLIELNTSNAAGGTAHGADTFRVRHETATLLARRSCLAAGDVIVRAYSPDTKVQPEILLRTALLAHQVELETGVAASVASAWSPLTRAAVNVVHGAIPDLVPHIEVLPDGSMTYRDHRVILVCNSNLLGQLARRDRVDLAELVRSIEPGLTHEGSWLTMLGFDKTGQQDAYNGTSIVPVRYVRTAGVNQTIDVALAMARDHGGAFIKPNAVSGGALAVPVDPRDTADDIAAAITPELDLMNTKYGAGWEDTCPLAVYEFVHSQPALVDGLPRRWDLRWALHARPDEVHVTPLLARLCPGPIDDTISKANAVCNITGRATGSVPVLNPAELATAAGVSDEELRQCAEGLYTGFCHAAAATDLPLPS